MIVVDASVWIPFFNDRETPQQQKLHALLGREPLIVGDLILCEVLQGARSEKHARILEQALRQFDFVSMIDHDLAVLAATHYRALRSRGVTIRTVDLVIGTFCIAHDHELLHADGDFDSMERHLQLKVVRAEMTINEPRLAYACAAWG